MKNRNLIALPFAVVLLCSCIPSVEPFYTEKDAVFDARLLGQWKEEEPETWKFEKGENDAYQLTITENGGKEGRFEAHLFQLKKEYFLDIIPVDCQYATNKAD